jgi:hypothetical protein
MHAYQRGSTNGVTYIVSGGGGGTIDTEVVANWALANKVEYTQYHFDIMEINGGKLSWEMYNDANQLLDAFVLPSRIPTLAWQRAAAAGGNVPLTLTGKPGTTYVLEGSTNLVNWSAFATNALPAAGPSTVTNAIPVNIPMRFIRARTSL